MHQTWSRPHPAMWQPANKAALPSPGDFEHAKKAINDLEYALTLVVLENAQSRVLALTQELDERKAWIAPVRKLPSELLSEIFILWSEMEHLAPVKITEVSRLWRAVVLATPRAWSLIYASAPEHARHVAQYVSTFVERSNPCLLHISIQDFIEYDTDGEESEFEPPADRVLPLLLSSLSRIQCLSIASWRLRKLSEERMPNLARLRITDFSYDIHPFFINRDQFPRLRSIQSMDSTWRDPLSMTSFPPLQELAIRVNQHPTWLEVVKNCSVTLKTLYLTGQLEWAARVTIIFPRLLSLTLFNVSGNLKPEDWRISMVTPGLISYAEFSLSAATSRLLHDDVGSVTYLRSSHLPDLASFTSLRGLWLSPTYNSRSLAFAAGLVEQLKRDSNTSPALQLVEFPPSLSSKPRPELESTKRDIIGQIKSARPGIEVSFTRRFGPMPGSIEDNSCKLGMPCS